VARSTRIGWQQEYRVLKQFKPLQDRILVRRLKEREVKKSGIIIMREEDALGILQ